MNKFISKICSCFLFSIFIFNFSYAQKSTSKFDNPSGSFFLGVRNVISIFSSEGKSYFGSSVGGQLRLRIDNKLNSDWFGDYITTNVGNLAQRTDVHGGVSMMPYVFGRIPTIKKVSYFPLAGFCIDYTKFRMTNGKYIGDLGNTKERYSFATQLGVGFNFPLTNKIDFTMTTHYMLHIGSDVDIDINGDNVAIIQKNGTNLEGHFILSYSLNFKLFELW